MYYRKWILRLLGLGLLVTAGLKAQGMMVPQLGPLYSAWFHVTLIYAESLLGLWFLLGQETPLKWILASLVLCIFAGANLAGGIEGRATCECFGPLVKANPWIVFGAEIAILALLFSVRPSFADGRLLSDLRICVKALLAVAVATTIVIVSLVVIFGSIEQGLAKARGEVCSMSPRLVDFGVARPGEVKEVTVIIANFSDQPLRILGGTANCSFLSTLDLPGTVPERDSLAIRIAVKFPPLPGRFTQTGKLLIGGSEISAFYFQGTGTTILSEKDD